MVIYGVGDSTKLRPLGRFFSKHRGYRLRCYCSTRVCTPQASTVTPCEALSDTLVFSPWVGSFRPTPALSSSYSLSFQCFVCRAMVLSIINIRAQDSSFLSASLSRRSKSVTRDFEQRSDALGYGLNCCRSRTEGAGQDTLFQLFMLCSRCFAARSACPALPCSALLRSGFGRPLPFAVRQRPLSGVKKASAITQKWLPARLYVIYNEFSTLKQAR